MQRESLLSRYRPESQPVHDLDIQIAQSVNPHWPPRPRPGRQRPPGGGQSGLSDPADRQDPAHRRGRRPAGIPRHPQWSGRAADLAASAPGRTGAPFHRLVARPRRALGQCAEFAICEQQSQASAHIAARTNDNIRIVERASVLILHKSLRKPVAIFRLPVRRIYRPLRRAPADVPASRPADGGLGCADPGIARSGFGGREGGVSRRSKLGPFAASMRSGSGRREGRDETNGRYERRNGRFVGVRSAALRPAARAISFVAARTGQGTSTVAREFASHAARRGGRRTWLIDLDMMASPQAPESLLADPQRYGPLGRPPPPRRMVPPSSPSSPPCARPTADPGRTPATSAPIWWGP